jgi:cleavage and polyadenylation specificity factor subunit 1
MTCLSAQFLQVLSTPRFPKCMQDCGKCWTQLVASCALLQVRYAVFLHRYSEPVLLVLHEEAPTWTGNLRARKDTMAVTALSVNVLHKRLTLLWATRDLPSDAAHLSAAPLGGALVLCRSLVKYVAQVHSCLDRLSVGPCS